MALSINRQFVCQRPDIEQILFFYSFIRLVEMTCLVLKLGQYLQIITSFVIEVIATILIFFSIYSGIKSSGINYFIILLLAFSILINSSIYVSSKFLRITIIVDLLILTACFIVINWKVKSEFIIKQVENLRTLENTCGIYKKSLTLFEKLMNCCRVPTLVG